MLLHLLHGFLTTWFLSFCNNFFSQLESWSPSSMISNQIFWSCFDQTVKTCWKFNNIVFLVFPLVGFFLLCQIYFQTFPELCLAICGRVTLHKQIKSFRLHTGIIRSHKAFLIESRSAGKTGRCSKQSYISQFPNVSLTFHNSAGRLFSCFCSSLFGLISSITLK